MDPDSLTLEELEELLPKLEKKLKAIKTADIYQAVIDDFDKVWSDYEKSLERQYSLETSQAQVSQFLITSIKFVLRKHSVGGKDIDRIFKAISKAEKTRDFYMFHHYLKGMYKGDCPFSVAKLAVTIYKLAMLYITEDDKYGSYTTLRKIVSDLRTDKDPVVEGMVSDFEDIGLFPAKRCLDYSKAMEKFFSLNLLLA